MKYLRVLYCILTYIKLSESNNASTSEVYWDILNARIQQRIEKTRFSLNRLFVFNHQLNDFESLQNETLTILMDYRIIENKTIRIGAPEFLPYIQAFNDTDKITGFVGDIWNVIEEFLKFKTNVTKTTFNDGTFLLLDNYLDVMLTAGIATTGYKMLEYSQPYFFNWYQLYMRLPSRTPNSTFYVRTLTPTFWYACIGVFLVLTVTLRFTVRVLNRVGCKYHDQRLEPALSLPTCFLSVISGFFNQGFDVRVRSYSARAQVIIALVFGYMVYTGMSAVLVSELAVSELQMPVRSLDDVVNKGKWALCVRDDSFVNEILLDDKRYSRILNTKNCMKNGKLNPKRMLCESEVVVLESQAMMTTFLMSGQTKCEILTISGKYFQWGNSIMINKRFKYRKLIYLYMEKLRGNGILQKLQNQWVRPMKIEDINPPATIEVTLYHVKGILVLYGATVLFSFIVLIVECIISKCSQTRFDYID